MDNRQLAYAATKKSALVAIILNLVLPGAGRVYCGSVFTGFSVFIISTVALVYTMGIAIVVVYPALVIDAVSAASAANKRLGRKLGL